MYEFHKSVINSPEITINIIQKVLVFLRENNKEKINKIYKMILNAKNLSDFEKIQDFIEK
jgi:hypothetical protein